MEIVEIDEKFAKKIYSTSPDLLKTKLEDKFGKKVLCQSILDRINSWEDAAADMDLHPVDDLPFREPKNNRQIACNAFFIADVFTEVLLEGTVLDWTNPKQKKYGFYLTNYIPGSGFSVGDTFGDWTDTRAYGGARLYLDSEEKVRHFIKICLAYINQLANPIK